MPFVTTRRQAAQRAARRRPRALAEIQAAQLDYQRQVGAAQERLTGAQTAIANEFSELSRQYEDQLRSFESDLSAYNQRAEDYAARVDSYINTINEIERARGENIVRQLSFMGGLADIMEAPYLKRARVAEGHTVQGDMVTWQEDVGGEGSQFVTRQVPLSEYNPDIYGRPVRTVSYGIEEVPVPETPEDPGSFTETFTRAAPTAPQAGSLEADITRFREESEAARVRMEREIGERRAGTMRARQRFTDRPLLSGA